MVTIGKGSGDKQHSGGGENSRSKSDDPTIKDKVRQVIEMTRRSEEEVCLALHECDYDTESAINLLFENLSEVIRLQVLIYAFRSSKLTWK